MFKPIYYKFNWPHVIRTKVLRCSSADWSRSDPVSAVGGWNSAVFNNSNTPKLGTNDFTITGAIYGNEYDITVYDNHEIR